MLRYLLDILYGIVTRDSERTSSGAPGPREKTVNIPRATYAKGMAEAPVSFVVGEPEHEHEHENDPDPNRDSDFSEMLEIEDSFPGEGSDNGNAHVNHIATGLVERRKRLR
ncbi:hypothetical protein PUN28_002378 [Cardiocondyla obscurior]